MSELCESEYNEQNEAKRRLWFRDEQYFLNYLRSLATAKILPLLYKPDENKNTLRKKHTQYFRSG